MDEIIDETNEECTTTGTGESDDYASKVRELDKELQAALKEFSSHQEQTETIKMDYFRKRNALYSQRKYYRMKYGLAYLSKKKRKLQKSKEELKAEHKRLKTLISIANSVIESGSIVQNNAPDKSTELRKSMPEKSAPDAKQLHAVVMKRQRDVPGCYPIGAQGNVTYVNAGNDAIKPNISQEVGSNFHDTQFVSAGKLPGFGAQRLLATSDARGTNVFDCGEVSSTTIANHLFARRGTSALFYEGQVHPNLSATTPLAECGTGAPHMGMGKIIMNSDRSWPASFSLLQNTRMPCMAVFSSKTSDNNSNNMMIQSSKPETIFSDFCRPNNGVVQHSTEHPNPTAFMHRSPFTTTCWKSSSPVLTPGNCNFSSGVPSTTRNLPIRGFLNPSGQVSMAAPDAVSRSFNPSKPPTQLSINVNHGLTTTTVHPVTVVSRANHQRSILDTSAMNSGTFNPVSPLLGNTDDDDMQCRIDNIRRLQQTLNQEIDSLSNLPELPTPVRSSMNVDSRMDHNNSQARIIGSGQLFSRQLVASRPTRPGGGGFAGNSLMQHRSYHPVTTIGVLPDVVEEARRSSYSSIPLFYQQQ